jgi:hypothetical protein
MDDTGAPLTLQKELMRHASIQTTMNVYGKAMTDTKRKANSKVVEMILKPKAIMDADPAEPVWLLGVNGSLVRCSVARNLLKRLVAGVGFEPTTFGL